MLVYMQPHEADYLGIGRVVSAYAKYLPTFGVEFTRREAAADLIVMHAAEHAQRETDVTHIHGLYPTATIDAGKPECFVVNNDVLQNVKHSVLVTVPSQWVADIFRRDMNFEPWVLPHGIDIDDWPMPAQPGNYVLWSKGHDSGVVSAKVVNELANLMPTTKFISTKGDKQANVEVTGVLPYEQMRKTLQGAGIYLATTKETFGIQTLEALACGLPVIGYAEGATTDLITNDYNGKLVPVGDVNALREAIIWAWDNLPKLRQNARQSVLSFSWLKVAEQVAKLYQAALTSKQIEPVVSIIIPSHNYAQYLPAAIDSVLAQTYAGPVEVIVVDDASTDNTADIMAKYVDKVQYYKANTNIGVSEARNFGIRAATGQYIVCLDADDALMPTFLSKLMPSMLTDRSLGAVYGKLIVERNGQQTISGWPTKFDYQSQLTGLNQVPSASLFRKEAWLRAGGYHQEYMPAEDAKFFQAVASIGYDIKQVTTDPVYIYRMHQGSASSKYPEPNWHDATFKNDPNITPIGAPTEGRVKYSYPVRNYDEPWVSIIIPVGPYHADKAWRAVESVLHQSMPYWELLVMNDTDGTLRQPHTGVELGMAYKGIKVVNVPAPHGVGPAVGRNLGATLAKADFLVFLDADDMLQPDFLADVVNAYNTDPNHYVYTDWNSTDGKLHTAQDFDCKQLLHEALHPVTALVPKKWHDEAGGFDTGLVGWEDWDYYLKIANVHGHCGIRVPRALIQYDYDAGARREYSLAARQTLLPTIRQRYPEGTMACGSCGKKAAGTPAVITPNISTGVSSMVTHNTQQGMVLVTENSHNQGRHSVVGARTRINYGMHVHGDTFQMQATDQAAQPHIFILAQPVAAVAANMVPAGKPVAPTAMERVMPAPVMAADVAKVTAAAPQPVAVDEGIDLAVMPLQAIKMLDWDVPSALDALDAERADTNRPEVIEFLEGYLNKHATA